MIRGIGYKSSVTYVFKTSKSHIDTSIKVIIKKFGDVFLIRNTNDKELERQQKNVFYQTNHSLYGGDRREGETDWRDLKLDLVSEVSS